MTILALDQSTKHTGWAFFNDDNLVKSGVINSNPKSNSYDRMHQMHTAIRDLVDDLSPAAVAFEQVQFQSNYKVYSQLSQMQGIVLSILFDAGIPFCIIEPSSWKSFAGIEGRKREVQKENTINKAYEVYGVSVSEDEADAIFIGYWAINNFKEI